MDDALGGGLVQLALRFAQLGGGVPGPGRDPRALLERLQRGSDGLVAYPADLRLALPLQDRFRAWHTTSSPIGCGGAKPPGTLEFTMGDRGLSADDLRFGRAFGTHRSRTHP